MSNSRWNPFDEDSIEVGTYYAYHSNPRAYLHGNITLLRAYKTANGSTLCDLDGVFLFDHHCPPTMVMRLDFEELTRDLPLPISEDS